MKKITIFVCALIALPINAQAQMLTGPQEQSGQETQQQAPSSPAPVIAAPKNTGKNAAPPPKPATSKKPLEIAADNTLEWLRADKRFIARGDALAVQGDSSIAAETLTADYRDGSQGSMEIHTLTADDNVVLTSKDSKAYGDQAVYKLDEGLATLTGQDLKMVSPDQTVTAKDRFEYWVTEGRVNAIGNAVAIRPKPQGRGQDKLEADKISAILKDNAQGQRVLDTLEATGNVVITTATEVATGSYAIYRTNTNKAELRGNVTIKRGPNILRGNRAEVDLNTDTSKIFGGSGQGGRVSGTFYPGGQ